MSQDGWTETPYKKGSTKKAAPKGCQENNGGAHLYGVQKSLIIKQDGTVAGIRHTPTCFLCGHRKPRATRKMKETLEVVSTTVYQKDDSHPNHTYEAWRPSWGYRVKVYDGDTDVNGNRI